MRVLAALVLFVGVGTSLGAQDLYRGQLQTLGGWLSFGFELTRIDGEVRARITNGSEVLEAPASFEGPTLVVAFPHYDSKLTATCDSETKQWSGTWTKRRGDTELVKMPFRAVPRTGLLHPPSLGGRADSAPLAGRWSVRFERSEDPAVLVVESKPLGQLELTFLTSTGDYRFIGGRYFEDRLEAGVFDGAHAFLFTAALSATGELSGEFFSGDRWRESWTATREPRAASPDGFSQVSVRSNVALSDVLVKDLDGRHVKLGELAELKGPVLITLLGTWCPNCHDEAKLLNSLAKEFGPSGLKILGIAFEVTSDVPRNAEQVRRFRARHGLTYPIYLGGPADKAQATEAFRALTQIKAYPTTLFVDRKGQITAIYSGYSGPATGEAHTQLVAAFRARIEALLR